MNSQHETGRTSVTYFSLYLYVGHCSMWRMSDSVNFPQKSGEHKVLQQTRGLSNLFGNTSLAMPRRVTRRIFGSVRRQERRRAAQNQMGSRRRYEGAPCSMQCRRTGPRWAPVGPRTQNPEELCLRAARTTPPEPLQNPAQPSPRPRATLPEPPQTTPSGLRPQSVQLLGWSTLNGHGQEH